MDWRAITGWTLFFWWLWLAPVQAHLWLELRLKQRRLRVWQDNRVIRSYPVAVGKPGWETPQGDFVVEVKVKDPVWQSFTSGQQIPARHPRNPLGRHWIGFWSDGVDAIGFHGTPYPETIGQAVSHGCVRMYPRDIAELFDLVEVGTPVRVRP